MPIKTILVPMDAGKAAEAALDGALAVGQQLGAHLEVLHIRADPRDSIPYLTEGATPEVVESILDAAKVDAEERAVKARKAYDSWRAAKGVAEIEAPPAGEAVSVAWREATGHVETILPRLGRLADLIAVARPAKEAPAPVGLETAL